MPNNITGTFFELSSLSVSSLACSATGLRSTTVLHAQFLRTTGHNERAGGVTLQRLCVRSDVCSDQMLEIRYET